LWPEKPDASQAAKHAGEGKLGFVRNFGDALMKRGIVRLANGSPEVS
jgi:hypothetical protein